MKKYEVHISKPAEKDLCDIVDYIKRQLLEPQISENLGTRIDKAILGLELMPERNALLEEEYFACKGLRKQLVENYIIFYTIDERRKTVTVTRILYARRNWIKLI